ncbi:DNA/RNA nuclease SfsA [Silvanigrella aquatica]|uniref:Sugar fermentation stimulation protein homolog n=1 Tax=Silvanigrella aquatica TaxID=1915309 RepID=A0A1L4D3U4_9BACT|nr:DNA/RNA nuclease SfsA [Silvanigrella aquatica]APJ04871.1 hypothetical protein AXG55_13605 [Silvanigrella aquatica]
MLLLKYNIELLKSYFIKRYKRFFVDVKIQSENILTVHCANSGSMKSCILPDAPAYILDSQNPERKLRFSLELLELEDGLACLNTSRANQFIEQLFLQTIGKKESEFFINAEFPYQQFSPWNFIKREAVFTKETRFDFCLSAIDNNKKCWVEVKSVSMKINHNTWAFPDAVTERGQKHLIELINAKNKGDDAWLFFVLMRGSEVSEKLLKDSFRIANEIDAEYHALFERAKKEGVRIALIIPSITLQGFSLRKFYILN